MPLKETGRPVDKSKHTTCVSNYIQGEGCGDEVMIVPLDLQILVRHWHGQPAGCNKYYPAVPFTRLSTDKR